MPPQNTSPTLLGNGGPPSAVRTGLNRFHEYPSPGCATPRIGPDLIRDRPAHRHRREKAYTIKGATVDHHLKQPEIVTRCRRHACAAGKSLRRFGHVQPFKHPHVGIAGEWPGIPLRIGALYVERGVIFSGSVTSSFRTTSRGLLVTRSMMWPRR